MALTVLLADDHGVLRDGVRRLLESHVDIKVVATADDGVEAVTKTEAFSPDVVVMDVSLPKLNGIDATRSIVQRFPATGVVMLSMHSSSEIVRQALLAGARGYLLKESAGEEVVRAVRAVAEGQRFLGEGIAGKVHAEFPYSPTGADRTDTLTRRERDVLHLIAEGKSNAEAATVLGLSPRSVETYRARLMQKLGIDDLPGLVKFAIRHGMTTLE
jgi:DNA-binding NarL/FixJ family response regulator